MNVRKISLIESLGPGGVITDGDWIETKDQDPSGNVRLIQLADIGDGIFLNKSRRFVSNQTAASLRCTMLERGDILIARLPEPLGRACILPDLNQPCIAAVDVCIIRPNRDHLRPKWLMAFINSPRVRTTIQTFAQGATRARVPTGKLKQLQITLPATEEQDKIISYLEKFRENFTCALTGINAQKYELTQLSDSIIYGSLHTGTSTFSIDKVLDEVKEGVGKHWKNFPVLGATRRGLALAKEPPGKNPQRYKPVFPGTVFYNPMRILIGSIAFVDNDDEPGITSPDYVVLKGKEGEVDSRWFYYWLRSPLGEQCIQSLARGAVRERMLFNRLAEGEIELPDFAQQQKASEALAQIKPMRAAIERQLKELKLMPQKILAQIFES